MKKLISLLGSLSLVTTSSVAVIACGKKDEIIDNTSYIQELIEEFKSDLQLITDQYWKSKNDKFFDVVDNDSTYKFLKQSTIEELVTDNGGPIIGANKMSPENRQYLIEDVNKILVESEMKRFFETNIDQEKYTILIDGLTFYNGFEPVWDSLEIDFTKDALDPSGVDNFTSYVSLTLKLNFTYIDYNNEIARWDYNQRFIFTLTSDGMLIEAIQNLETKITNQYYLEGGKYSWLEGADFGYGPNQDMGKIFNPPASDFNKIYKKDSDFSNDIIDFIDRNYFSSLQNVPLIFTEDNIFDSFTKIDAINSNFYEKNYDFADGKGGLALYNSIFSELVFDDQVNIFGTQTDVNPNIRNYLLAEEEQDYPYINLQLEYHLRNNIRKNKLQKETGITLDSSKDTPFRNSVTTGVVKLNGLAVKVGEGYTHPINDFLITISLAAKNDESITDLFIPRNSYYFGAMYYNTILGIQAFQDIFDIKPRTDTKADFPIVRFSGQGTSTSGQRDSIWNEIRANGYSITELNESLSLMGDKQVKHRDALLSDGSQTTFEWNLKPTISTNRTGTYFNKVNTGEGILTGPPAASTGGDDFLIWHFKQNFINISFKISANWKVPKMLVIEKTEK